MAAEAALDQFNAFLDDLALDREAAGHGVDPSLSAAAKRLRGAVDRLSPDSDFATQLRRSLIGSPASASDSLSVLANTPPPPRPSNRRIRLVRRAFVTEGFAVAVALLLIAGLVATGRLSLPSWFGEDEPPHLAAPSVPIYDASPTQGWYGYPGNMSAQSTDSTGSEITDPFPLGSTVVTTTELVNFRLSPELAYDNIIDVLSMGKELTVRGGVFHDGDHAWLPVFDEESGAAGYIAVDLLEPDVEVIRQSVSAATPAPGSVSVLFIVDKSGSMSYDPLGQTSKLDWELETVRRALGELAVGRQIGTPFGRRSTRSEPRVAPS